jgi:hypothetical protein
MRVVFIFVFVSLFTTGCFFGTFQTAETLGPGNVTAGWYANLPLYFDKEDKTTSKEKGYGAFEKPNVGGYLLYGAGDNVDFGLRGSLGEGVGPVAKIRFINEATYPFSGALMLGLAYHPFAQGISLRSDVLISKRLSPFSSIYFGWTGVRSPDYRKVAFFNAKDIEEFDFFQAIFLGVDLRRKSFEDPRKATLPFGLTMEFAFPLTPYPALFFGIQFKR